VKVAPTSRPRVEGEKEVMSRSVKCCVSNIALALALSVGAGAAFVAGPAMAGDCGGAKNAKVKEHCEKGGDAAVKKYMQDLVKAAKAKGKKTACDDCHANQKTFELKDAAAAEKGLNELQALTGM